MSGRFSDIDSGQRPWVPETPWVNREHPFARGLRFGMIFNAGRSKSHKGVPNSQATNQESIAPFWGSVAPRTVNANFATDGPPQDGYSIGGVGASDTTPDGNGVLMSFEDYIDFGPDPMPSGAITILAVQRLWHPTQDASMGMTVSAGNTAKYCNLHLPYTGDNNCYWDYGGSSSGTSRLIVAQSWNQVARGERAERFVATAGPAGMALWRNGVKIGSHTTANSGRTVDTAASFRIGSCVTGGAGGGFGGGGRQHWFFFQVNDGQWPDIMCRQWSAQPYAHLYEPDHVAWAEYVHTGAPDSLPWLFRSHTQTLGAGFSRGDM